MRKLLVLVPLGFTLACCDSVRNGTHDLPLAPDRSHISPKRMGDSAQHEPFRKIQPGVSNPGESFAAFWHDFREAIRRKDSAVIIQLTRFPFRTRGEPDNDPVVAYAEADFPRVLEVYLQQREYTSIVEEQSQFELISNTHYTLAAPDTTNWVRVGDLQFEKTNGKWQLVFAFLNRESREKLTAYRQGKREGE